MDHTPDSAVHLQNAKNLYFGSSSDSGFSDMLNNSDTTIRAKHAPCRFLSSDDFNETPKENVSLSTTPKKERNIETVRFLDKDFRRVQQPSAVGWCETPKVCKKDATLRRRLLMCNVKSTTDAVAEISRTPCTKGAESSLRVGAKNCYSRSSGSPEFMFGALASSTLKSELDGLSPLSARKRRQFFSQVKTSTLEYGKTAGDSLYGFERNLPLSPDAGLNDSFASSGHGVTEQLETPRLGKCLPALTRDNPQTPVNAVSTSPCPGLCALNTPSSLCTPTYNRSLSEDSGFGSHDKSQDSSGDHDGSYQDSLLSSAPRARCETPQPAEVRRRSRLQRQQKLSTLQEGGSQSEEDPRNVGKTRSVSDLAGKKHKHQRQSPCKVDDVFLTADVTPSSSSAVKLGNRGVGVAAVRPDAATPRRTPTAKGNATASLAGHNVTPLRTARLGLDGLSLTPALQLVQAMCLQKASMMLDQSPSLEEELRSAAALVKTPMSFRTSMPLAGLIGRKMGLGKMDVLTELKKRNLRHILAVILDHLAPEDVHRFGQVSTSWNGIILQDKRARCRRKLHLAELEAALELGGAVHVPGAETRLALAKRAVLGSVQSQTQPRGFGYCTPQSTKGTLTPSQLNSSHSGGGGSSKREKFLQVAKTLFSDECLKSCPRCQHPAKCHSVKKEAVCSRADCGFRFCTGCLCAFHGAKECLSRSAGRHGGKEPLLPGSARSKRSLRRL